MNTANVFNRVTLAGVHVYISDVHLKYAPNRPLFEYSHCIPKIQFLDKC